MLGFPLETSWKCCKHSHFKMLKKMSLALKSYIRLTNLFIPDFFFPCQFVIIPLTALVIRNIPFFTFALWGSYTISILLGRGALFIQCFPGHQLGLNYLYLLVTSTRCKVLDGLCVSVCVWMLSVHDKNKQAVKIEF